MSGTCGQHLFQTSPKNEWNAQNENQTAKYEM